MAVGFPTKANWAAGDVLTASALDDLAGTVNLLSNASATTGSQLISNAAGTSFAYQATPSASNPILNSSFNVWQRGTTSATITTATKTYGPDRWYYALTGTGSMYVTRQATSDTTNLPFVQYCARVQRTAGNTNTSSLLLTQPLETVNAVPYAGKTVTMSFYARAGANFSAASNNLTAQLITGTGTDESQFGGYTGQAVPISATATLTANWQRFTATAALASTTTEYAVSFQYAGVGTAGANDYFEVTGIQVDIGSVALPFRTYAATLQGELSAAQRYYYRQTASTANATFSGFGPASSGTIFTVPVPLPVTMRTYPQSLDVNLLSSNDNVNANQSGGTWTLTSNAQGTNQALVSYTHGSSVFTQYRSYQIQANNSTSAYLGFSAEL